MELKPKVSIYNYTQQKWIVTDDWSSECGLICSGFGIDAISNNYYAVMNSYENKPRFVVGSR